MQESRCGASEPSLARILNTFSLSMAHV
ncbi:hypothetical protein AvCA_09820 [Azotobacter vinelandii CA]|uniref:Uncharacterized protein n=2 Tax=Azotobacter vinelandii TaxID=354 RepID=C1DNJ8_AZOVD|nr:hypothetical protein Avin_09820 [Azotobacter vinelandii DJ]AGK15441.1 hypothetical protein AvCA_09820 [Azotobacter vinelandii CA]AGK19642.1 hypothetical protein AvCA6_09820 [Azotobacter vinelandii CA6]